jgi:hypothetical protein
MPHRTSLALLCLLLRGIPLSAQVSTASPGDRVRVRLPCAPADGPQACAVIAGRLVAPATDSLVLEDEHGMTRRIDVQAGTVLERSVGSRRHTLLGLGIGALVGVGTGAALVSGCTQGGRGEDDGLCNLYYFGSIPAGAGLGALVGALIRTERWEVLPLAGRTAVGFTLRF